jgi:hypothetical protein
MSVCAIASPTIANLCACQYLHGDALREARDRIRVGIGALESFAQVWPRANKIVREVKIIARQLLGLGPSKGSIPFSLPACVVGPEPSMSGPPSISDGPPLTSEDFFAALAASDCGLLADPQGSTGFMLMRKNFPLSSAADVDIFNAGTVRVSE